ncbi:GlsB/YeaQ/YmgE family stress response membrane protein [Dysgonomonas sp. 25]|uniref:GlsB/YeaQ/YmgE family stress response membrane protein n=1 Tax=Dysgonomonas sp. 25 TaxID=2302933 RepID=UPI0013CF5533|nr:GlsB/YeaQ/YmgE family stress response membrane protein [Dysgonomonas sp. 25]NDV67842.1 GlsB/YeaQ/YmgE family stress response membrane protein [Dysgonomonas sp. 25]
MGGLSILWSIIIGLVAGAIAGWIMKGRGFGFIINLIIGLLGSVIGGWIYGLLGFSAHSILGVLLMSVVGAVVLLFVVSLFRKPKA